jgi:two-component system CheB/CheR fusion protein
MDQPETSSDREPSALPDAGLPFPAGDGLEHPGLAGGLDSQAGPQGAATAWEAFQQLLVEVHARTGRDLARYTTTAVAGRVRARMQAHGLGDIRDYLAVLYADGREARRLSDAFWPPPSGDFAPPAALLAEDLLPVPFRGKGVTDQVRAWVVGCATGEEAYGLAMLLLDHASRLEFAPEVRVFASDPRSDMLLRARSGVYPEGALSHLPPAWIPRYFEPVQRGLRLRRRVRDTVLFAEHHVLDDAPFIYLDLVVCRGYMLQLRDDIMAQVLELFHHVLRPEGCLCAGEDAELIRSDLFRVAARPDPSAPGGDVSIGGAPQACLRRLSVENSHVPLLPITGLRRSRADAPWPRLERPPVQGEASERLAALTPAPGIMVDADYSVLYIGAEAGRYLHQSAGEPSADALRLVRPEFHADLSLLLGRAFQTRARAASRTIVVRLDGEVRLVRLAVQPVTDPDLPGRATIEFQEVADSPPVDDPAGQTAAALAEAEAGSGPDAAHYAALQEENAGLRSQLRRMAEEHSIAQEEMAAINEELRGINEELHLALTDLEASKRDLRASNRELALVNLAHHAHISELNRTTSDLQNFLGALDIATIFLDRNLCVRRFTPRAGSIFNLVPEDLGRALGHITHSLRYIGLLDDAGRVLETLQPLRTEVASDDDRWYLMQLLPYRAHDERIDGVVLTFVEITDRKQAEMALQELNEELEGRVAERTAELERSNRELDQFAYIASHDLKAPLRAITFLANWVSEDAGPALPEAARGHLVKLIERVARMDALLNDLLTYSRAGRQRHAPVSIQMEELVRNVTDLVAPPDGFTVSVAGEPPGLAAVRAERVPLELVLRNLVSNAVKHHENPGAGHVWITYADAGDHYGFTVRDDGPGIDPAYHQRIFELFERLRPRDLVEGSGLGLAVVKKAVESRGGRVALESAPGTGSTFRFTWPKVVEE